MKYVGYASTKDSLKVVSENDLKMGADKTKQTTACRDYMTVKVKTYIYVQNLFNVFMLVTIVHAKVIHAT